MKCPEQANPWRHKAQQLLRAGGREKWGVTIHGYGISFEGDKNVPELNSSDDCTTVWTY